VNKPTQKSRRHHFIPQFYLRTWEALDGLGLWLYFRNQTGILKAQRRFAASIGYSEELYMLHPDGLNFETESSDELERNFMALWITVPVWHIKNSPH
jgi:hypothetical protein